MFYLIAGIIELISMALLSLFHSGMIANISGMVMFVTAVMIPLANFMTVARTSGNHSVKLLLAVTSCLCMLLELIGLTKMTTIPDAVLKLMLVYIGISSILVYVDQKRHPGHRSVSQETQDTLR